MATYLLYTFRAYGKIISLCSTTFNNTRASVRILLPPRCFHCLRLHLIPTLFVTIFVTLTLNNEQIKATERNNIKIRKALDTKENILNIKGL
jgi:hypothetical protein